LGLAVAPPIVNALPPRRFTAGDAAALDRLEAASGSHPYLRAARFQLERRRQADAQLTALRRGLGAAPVRLPFLFGAPDAPAGVAAPAPRRPPAPPPPARGRAPAAPPARPPARAAPAGRAAGAAPPGARPARAAARAAPPPGPPPPGGATRSPRRK